MSAGAMDSPAAPDQVESTLSELVADHHIVICCGPGGVGKTTIAAAIALEGARTGRRSVVVTIDPAKRLADALGVGELSDTPHRIEGDWPGELWALMLDTKSTFDDLVTKYAPTPEQAKAILGNRFYRNIAGALSGTQEYMAMEKLHELYDDGRFDLIVVDTPPTRNALDFIDAPTRLTRFLDNRFLRLLMLPTRASLKAINFATQTFLRTIGRVVGSHVVRDAVAFFQAFEGMEDGFRERAQRVLRLLSDPVTAFVLVTSPRRDSVEEVEFFAEKLSEADIAVKGLVVNLMQPRFGSRLAGADRQRATTLAGTQLGTLYANIADLHELADGEEVHLQSLLDRMDELRPVRVPMLSSDVHDLAGLDQVGAYVFAG